MNCRACGSSQRSFWARATDFEYCSTGDDFTYYRCEDCGALSIDPVPEDRLGEIYPPTYYSFDGTETSFLEQVKQALDRRLFKKAFGQISGSELAALDVGGGTGWLLNQARIVEPRLCSSVVVDIDPKAGVAAEKAGHEYFCGRIEEFETDQKFDLILMLNIIEHVKDPTSVLKKAKELLTDDGIILIKTPNYDSLDARIFRSTYWGGLHCPRHWVIFTPESFRLAANSAGLSVSELALTQGAPFWVWSLIHQLSRLGWTKVSYERPMHRNAVLPWFLAAFAAFDLLRGRFMRTSQMFVILKRK